jgi:RimK family alpha-L-glutamate ligase
VTLRLSLLHALAAEGVPVANEARAIERCVDKGMTSFLLARAGLPTPPALVTEAPERAAAFRKAAPGDVVLKPLFGSQGRGIRRLPREAPLPDAAETSGVWYLQHFIGRAAEWRDCRVFVVGQKPVAAMIRHGASWLTNVHQGARVEATECDGAVGELAVAAAAAVGADFAGVDLMEDGAGRVQVLEVNSMPAWKGLQSVAATDIATALIDHVHARIG